MIGTINDNQGGREMGKQNAREEVKPMTSEEMRCTECKDKEEDCFTCPYNPFNSYSEATK